MLRDLAFAGEVFDVLREHLCDIERARRQQFLLQVGFVEGLFLLCGAVVADADDGVLERLRRFQECPLAVKAVTSSGPMR